VGDEGTDDVELPHENLEEDLPSEREPPRPRPSPVAEGGPTQRVDNLLVLLTGTGIAALQGAMICLLVAGGILGIVAVLGGLTALPTYGYGAARALLGGGAFLVAGGVAAMAHLLGRWWGTTLLTLWWVCAIGYFELAHLAPGGSSPSWASAAGGILLLAAVLFLVHYKGGPGSAEDPLEDPDVS
jgi:hypothetical protein